MGNVGSKWLESVQRLSEAQLQAGQSAFDALNEHDKLLQLIRTLALGVEEVFSSMDMANMELAATLEKATRDAVQEEEQQRLLLMNEENMRSAEQFAQMLQNVMTAAEIGSEVIHRMEGDIASAQEALQELCLVADELVAKTD